MVHGYLTLVEIDEIKFPTEYWTPVLLSLVFNHLPITKYFLEELNLNP